MFMCRPHGGNGADQQGQRLLNSTFAEYQISKFEDAVYERIRGYHRYPAT